MNQTYLSQLAATTSGNIAELAAAIEDQEYGSELAQQLRDCENSLDRSFNLRTISCPVEPI